MTIPYVLEKCFSTGKQSTSYHIDASSAMRSLSQLGPLVATYYSYRWSLVTLVAISTVILLLDHPICSIGQNSKPSSSTMISEMICRRRGNFLGCFIQLARLGDEDLKIKFLKWRLWRHSAAQNKLIIYASKGEMILEYALLLLWWVGAAWWSRFSHSTP